MIVLDTNVVSELLRANPEVKVLDWLKKHSKSELFVSVLTIMELRFGLALLSDGPDKHRLDVKIDTILNLQFSDRTLVFGEATAKICSGLMAKKRAFTPFVKIVDLQIAATALENGFSVATRDINDFDHEGLRVVNPWTD
jgi:toxin FitB